jgi:hypothetical protein
VKVGDMVMRARYLRNWDFYDEVGIVVSSYSPYEDSTKLGATFGNNVEVMWARHNAHHPDHTLVVLS